MALNTAEAYIKEFTDTTRSLQASLEVSLAKKAKLSSLVKKRNEHLTMALGYIFELKDKISTIRDILNEMIDNKPIVIQTPSLESPESPFQFVGAESTLTPIARVVKEHVLPLKENYIKLDNEVNILIAELLKMEHSIVVGYCAGIRDITRLISEGVEDLSKAKQLVQEVMSQEAQEALAIASTSASGSGC